MLGYYFRVPQPVLRCFWLPLCLLLLNGSAVTAVAPTEALDVYLLTDNGQHTSDPSYSFFVSKALFGSTPAQATAPASTEVPWRKLVRSPSENPLLCQNITSAATVQQDDNDEKTKTIMLVPRGACSFQTKAWHAQQLGADALIVHGSLSSHYKVNKTTHKSVYTDEDLLYPKEFDDYDCKLGRALVPSAAIAPLDPNAAESVYDAAKNDPVLSGKTKENLCLLNSDDQLQTCPSSACLLTGNQNASTMMKEACCAWDTYMWLAADTEFEKSSNKVEIPAAYATMEEGFRLLKDLDEHTAVYVKLYSRWRPKYNFASYLIWMMGVAVAALAAHLSAGEYHGAIKKIIRREQEGSESNPLQRSAAVYRGPQAGLAQEELELTAWHAVGFIALASCSLLILFYFKIYNFVKVMYALGCSKAVQQIIMFPAMNAFRKRFLKTEDVVVWRTNTEDFGDITMLDIVSHVVAYAWGLAWLITAFTMRHPEELAFFWISQDVFGASVCCMFLQIVKLNSIQVASTLLIVAFFYDIFFVFISPRFFNSSVMVTVATSGGPPKRSEEWCEKYPDDPDCQGGDPLPMLLTIPRLYDFLGGSSLLGLGDIVIPGLLLSFAARFDAAKRLTGLVRGGNGNSSTYHCPEQKYFCRGKFCAGGYFPPLVVAYAIGLMMANVAVVVMDMGQPALLYLVPCCLGTFTVMARRRNELADLWDGPAIFNTADRIIYGDQTPATSPMIPHEPVPTDEGCEAPVVPSAS